MAVKLNKRVLIGAVVVVAIAGLLGYLLWPKPSGPVVNQLFGRSYSATDSTQYGEYLSVQLNVGGGTSASWAASYTGSASQWVYTVNGTYKSQEQVTIKISLSVSYANVEGITLVDAYIKAVDTADNSYKVYDLADNVALSGSSPISWSNQVTRSISNHLTDAGASTSDATIAYYVYVKVQATGSISGQTLTAEIPLTKFTALHYLHQQEKTQAEATPSVTVASWMASWASITTTAVVLIIGVVVGYVIAKLGVVEVQVRKPRRRKSETH